MAKLPLQNDFIQWRQGELVQLSIDDMNHNGEGVGRAEGRVVFVPDTVVGDRLLARLSHVKPTYAYAKLHRLLKSSPHRVRPGCIVADKCGGCQWQHVNYVYQQVAKQRLIAQNLERIGGFSEVQIEPVLAAASPLSYRNKATYPLGRSATGQVQAGYYQKASHQLINLNQCPIQDARLNPLLAEIKQDIQQQGWSIYDETRHEGELRHLGLRIGRRTGEMLLTLVAREGKLSELAAQAQAWCDRYDNLVGVCLNLNPQKTNAIFGSETRCLVGRSFLREEFAGLQFQISATTFFQIHTEQAEALLQSIQQELNLQGTEVIVDAYCGVGTLTLPLAKQARQAIALELQPEAIEQAQLNAALNDITNITFQTGTVENLLPLLTIHPDVVLLDPPRKGCDRGVIESLLQIQPDRVVYVSCNPSTLARDLKLLCESGRYRLEKIQPVDFFPQTAHVECIAFLRRCTAEVEPVAIGD